MNKNVRNTILVLVIPILLIALTMSLLGTVKQSETPKYSEIVEKIYTGKITSFSLNLSSGHLEYYEDGNTAEADKKTYEIPDVSVFYEDVGDYIKENNQKAYSGESGKTAISYDYTVNKGSWLVNLLPSVLMFVGIGVLWYFMMKKMSAGMGNDKAMGFGKAKIKKQSDDKRKTTFADVAGADEEKEEMSELVEYLKDPKKFNDLGARIPKGVLLVGPPGTGKTLLARAVAGEAGVPFFSISGSDFVEMFVGVGASRVRDLFDQANKNSPAIEFID